MERLQHHWYRLSPLHLLLFPVSLVFRVLAATRRFLYRSRILASVKLPVPVVVVGNISVGGTGKTPLTLWLAQQLIDNGWHPGIISRGYTKAGGKKPTLHEVSSEDAADEVGDEPLLMAQRALCPVWIGRDRPAAALALLQAHPECDIVLSDDGLQHYRLQRDAEIAVVDGARRFGNGLLLPAGPLREPVSRLRTVDAVVINGGLVHDEGFAMSLQGALFYNLLNPAIIVSASEFTGQQLHAIAGIGHPHRFFAHLEHLGLNAQRHAFPDHHRYSAADIAFEDADAVLMTEKDAVKCAAFATEKCWVLRVDAQVDTALTQLILKKVTP
ncbi:tetraacyldisaccharide 4'-kinase [mine drainage metagenome]|uniref:tetraacyldisaccharide 4'-kinase n=1 Tax=mine drainage metagenome TaxID=410659 RepID=A0A1J5SIS5_9ZZZZ